MRQFSIKNEKAAKLLDQVTAVTGEGKTEAVISALELYRERLLVSPDVEAAVLAIRRKVHAAIGREQLGKAPSKTEIEAELGMP